jgi:outer membrane lipoprotein SlyB
VLRVSAALLISVLFFGCTAPTDPRYRVATIGNATRSTPAVVMSSEAVIIQRSNSGAGATAGGAMGAAVAAESSDNAAVIIAGIIGGAIIGNAIEGEVGKANGHQYLIETESGALLAVAQLDEGNTLCRVNDKVVLIYGHPHRLVLDPR